MNYESFSTEGEVNVVLGEYDIFDYRPDGRGLDFYRIGPRFRRVICHELGHFFDACCDPAFGYDRSDRPKLEPVLSVYHNLWEPYIDSRLGPDTPYSLLERQDQAFKKNGVAPEAVADAAGRSENASCRSCSWPARRTRPPPVVGTPR